MKDMRGLKKSNIQYGICLGYFVVNKNGNYGGERQKDECPVA
jgi:hypothetical protein